MDFHVVTGSYQHVLYGHDVLLQTPQEKVRLPLSSACTAYCSSPLPKESHKG